MFQLSKVTVLGPCSVSMRTAPFSAPQMPSLPYDSMTPQAIVEEEEVERVKALLRRENLIRGLGIVDQLTRLLRSTEPRPAEIQKPQLNISESQVGRCCFGGPRLMNLGELLPKEDWQVAV